MVELSNECTGSVEEGRRALNKDDLNKYLTEESVIIKQTSTSIDELLYLIEDAQSQFLALNKQIENIIN